MRSCRGPWSKLPGPNVRVRRAGYSPKPDTKVMRVYENELPSFGRSDCDWVMPLSAFGSFPRQVDPNVDTCYNP